MAANPNLTGPIYVSGPSSSLSSASGNQLSLNSQYPYAKLDSTMIGSFQIVQLFFNTEPPNPPADTWNKTLIYREAHGYKYVPSTWFLVSMDNFASAAGSEGYLVYGNITGFGSPIARLDIEVDATNINYYISKYTNPSGITPNIIGDTVNIRKYVFVEDLSGNSVPSKP